MFPHLFSPLKINGLTIRNRIVVTAHNTGLNDGLKIGERLSAYYAARARGGAGLLIMGSTSVHPSSNSRLRQAFANWDDDVIAEYAALSALVVRNGCHIMAQLNHAGAGAGPQEGGYLVAPSGVRSEQSPETPHALEGEEIAELVDCFARAAVRVRAGGMHGIEIHGGHGNLIQQFLSSLTNRRTDAYGGPLEARMRFGVEVIKAVRAAVGADFVVGLRISVKEDHDGGLTFEDAKRIVPAFVAAGKLDYVNVTSGSDLTNWSLANHYPSMYVRGQYLRAETSQMRKLVDVPVLLCGRVTDPRDAEAALAAGDADMVGMTRALIADRELPNKARSGTLDTIRYCVGANDGCIGRLFRGMPITCIQDPTSGREHTLEKLEPAANRKHILVIGGGVAGMEAAKIAALRGHRVTLVERSDQLGGQLRLARRAPERGEIGAVADNIARALARLPVALRLNEEASPALVATLAPDLVVIATGSSAWVPDYPDSEDRLVSARGALDGDRVGDVAVVFDTIGDHAGVMTADFLADGRRRVILVTPHRFPGHRIDTMTQTWLYKRLLTKDVAFHSDSEVARFTDEGVAIHNVISRRETLLRDVVTVVAACGSKAEDGLRRALREHLPDLPTVLIGDALAPRLIEQAIYEGHMAARAA